MEKRRRLLLLLALLALGGAPVSSAARAARGDHAIRAVLASPQGSGFRYFPHHAGTARCAIPYVFRFVEGTCTTRVAVRPGFSGQTFVNLSARWPWRKFHYSGTPRRRLHHHSVFDLLPSGKVLLAGQTGDFPPTSPVSRRGKARGASPRHS
jgi:hypothetical protein